MYQGLRAPGLASFTVGNPRLDDLVRAALAQRPEDRPDAAEIAQYLRDDRVEGGSTTGLRRLRLARRNGAPRPAGAPQPDESQRSDGVLAAFVAVERSAAQPIMPLRLFASRGRSGAYAARLLFLGGMMGFWFFTTQYLQTVRGDSPLAAGIAFLPMTVANFLLAVAVPRLTSYMPSPWSSSWCSSSAQPHPGVAASRVSCRSRHPSTPPPRRTVRRVLPLRWSLRP